MAKLKISVVGRSDLIVSKTSKKTYFTITDETDTKYICFNPSLYPEFEIGNLVDIEWQPGKNEGDTPRITGIASLGTEVSEKHAEVAKVSSSRKLLKRVDDEPTKNRSIALSYAKDLVAAGELELSNIIAFAEVFYGYMLGEQVKIDKEEAPKAEVKVASQSKSIEPALKNVGELFSRCLKAGINRKAAMEFLGVTDPLEILDLDDAWQTILENYNTTESK